MCDSIREKLQKIFLSLEECSKQTKEVLPLGLDVKNQLCTSKLKVEAPSIASRQTPSSRVSGITYLLKVPLCLQRVK